MKIFISYHFANNNYRGEVQKWLKKHYTLEIVKEKELKPESDQSGKNRIKEQLKACNALVVLVGDDTHNRPWVDYEVSVAVNYKLKIFWVRLPNTKGAAPEEIRNYPQLTYDEREIIKEISA